MYRHFITKVDTEIYDNVVGRLMGFCKSKGWTFDCKQQIPSILAACEDPFNIMTYNFNGNVWPMIQTNQMHLENELLDSPKKKYKGLYALTTSYRNEVSPIAGRHSRIFPMFEFESPGEFHALQKFVTEMLGEFGYQRDCIHHHDYLDVAERLGVKEIEAVHEKQIAGDYGRGHVIFLKKFPEYTSPFWNMKREGNLALKMDVIIGGQETIGSAERSTDVQQMSDTFHSISDGKYCQKLYHEFGKARVMRELNLFLNSSFRERYGGGIGLTRLIDGLRLDKKI